MLPDFTLVRNILRKQQNEYFKDCVRVNSGKVFNNIPESILHEGDRMMSIYSEEIEYETEIKKLESTHTFNVPEVLKNPLLIYEGYSVMAKDFAEKQVAMAIKTISEVSTLTGNVHQTKGKVTGEDILLMYEKVEFSFNSDGQPNLPSIVAGTEMYKQIGEVFEQAKNDMSFQARFEEIINKKRNKWNDRENNRKLVD